MIFLFIFLSSVLLTLRLDAAGFGEPFPISPARGSRGVFFDGSACFVPAPGNALFTAVQEGSAEKVAALLRESKPPLDVNQEQGTGMTPLYLAAREGHTIIAEMLLNHGATLSPTALYAAAERGQVAVMGVLLRHRADLEQVRDADGATVLTLAITYGHETMVNLLIGQCPQLVTQARKDGATPLILAAQYGTVSMMRALLTVLEMYSVPVYKAQVNARDAGAQTTALCAAAQRGEFEMVRILLNNGADSYITRGADGRTPLDVAREGKHETVANLLEAWNSKVSAFGVAQTGKAVAQAVMAKVGAAAAAAQAYLRSWRS